MFDQIFLNQIKKKLEKEKKRLERELKYFSKKDIHRINGYDAQFPDFGSEDDENAREVADFENKLALEKTLEKELRDINGAMEKIQSNTYGVCKYCKERISKARLLVRPTSSSCIKCKKKLKGEE